VKRGKPYVKVLERVNGYAVWLVDGPYIRLHVTIALRGRFGLTTPLLRKRGDP
jgi:hypothetical protein